MGAEPTGRSFRVEAMDMLRLENGRIAEHWGLMDSASMAEQLSLA
jgi:predicted ester cyclase